VEEGLRKMGLFVERQNAALAVWPAEPVDPFLNVNAPDDLAEAEALLTRAGEPD
jgi:molybdopterin-guanine dinucleotide biosynthesis protein A